MKFMKEDVNVKVMKNPDHITELNNLLENHSETLTEFYDEAFSLGYLNGLLSGGAKAIVCVSGGILITYGGYKLVKYIKRKLDERKSLN